MLSVLVVDAEAEDVRAVRRAFEAADSPVDVRAAASLREYREAVASRPPDVALIALVLPDGGALEALASGEDGARFPILVVTSRGDERAAVEAMRAGALNYVVKSAAAFEELPRAVECALREWELGQQRRRAEEALRESEARFRALVEQAGDGFELLDAEGRFVDANSVTCRRLGYSRQELLRMNIHDVDRNVSREQFAARFKSLVDRPPSTFESLHRRKDGSTFPVEITASVVSFGGSHWGLSLVRDITDRKRAEAERLELERRLLHAQKLESLGVLAGGVAHDFNNLLTGILGWLDLAAQGLSPDAPAAWAIGESLRAARRAAGLTRQMLAYSGRGTFAVQRVRLNELVQENLSLLRSGIVATTALSVDLSDGEPTIVADPGQVQQVVINLITNAAEAIGDGPGTVTLATGLVDCDEGRLVRSRLPEKPAPGRFAYLEVRDTGAGMDELAQERLFDPFFTTKAAGRGLGMPVVLGIVRGHKGAILVDSVPSRGTVIRVLFPTAEADSAASADTPAATSPPGFAAPSRVLLVDDEDVVRGPCEQFLRSQGVGCLAAASGDEAVTLLARHAGEIACVVLDLTMPGMSGAATFREMRRIKPDVRVILSSGFSEPDALRDFAGLRPDAFLQKPYRLHELLALIQKTLGGAPSQ